MGAGNGPLSPPPPSSVPDHAADAASDTGLAQILTLGAMPLKGGQVNLALPVHVTQPTERDVSQDFCPRNSRQPKQW